MPRKSPRSPNRLTQSKVLRTQYILHAGIDYTEAVVRVDGVDVTIRVGGFKASPDAYPDLIQAAEFAYRGPKPINGSVH